MKIKCLFCHAQRERGTETDKTQYRFCNPTCRYRHNQLRWLLRLRANTRARRLAA